MPPSNRWTSRVAQGSSLESRKRSAQATCLAEFLPPAQKHAATERIRCLSSSDSPQSPQSRTMLLDSALRKRRTPNRKEG